MANGSNSTACYGTTSSKPTHRFTENPPTSGPIDKESLQYYRLELFIDETNSVPLVGDRTLSLEDSKASHKAKMAAELESILACLS
ncbi:hypothetical protein F4814DRAFT_446616 [Daldinia grandis]|nr:hypothetical protein F4814DRAFT_446616 [Daldinia grandis]